MGRFSGPTYPNGITKSRLHETFVSYRDFTCTPEEFNETLTLIRLEESNCTARCEWRIDGDGNLVVCDLTLADPDLRLLVTEMGFRLAPALHRAPRVFISYAREDEEDAKRIYRVLRSTGYVPWFDKESLRPGERWQLGIERAIRDANYFLALLSSRSVSKRGFVQREIRHALDFLNEFPDTEIFIIPARLDPCTPTHQKLAELQWIDLFLDWDAAIQKIIRVIATTS